MEALSIALIEAPSQEWARVRRAQEGDMGSFEELYRTHAGRVYALCLRMSGDPGRARDLMQDVFLRVWERLGSFRGESKFSSWLHRLTVNVVLSDRRSRSRRPGNGEAAEDVSGLEHLPAASRPGKGLDLERAIAGLPTEARKTLVLHDIEGYRHGEIARMTGRSLGTCKSQLHRARKLLREALKR